MNTEERLAKLEESNRELKIATGYLMKTLAKYHQSLLDAKLALLDKNNLELKRILSSRENLADTSKGNSDDK